MLHTDTKNPSNTDTITSSKSLFAFKPRQVLLAEHSRRSKMTSYALKDGKSSQITSLTPETKGVLHQSILSYLHRNGFSKTLKRFQSEAQIQSDTWKAASLHLEDIFCKYSTCNADNNLNTSKKPELGNDEAIKNDSVCATKEGTITKKKKKGTVSDSSALEDQSKVIDKKMAESGGKNSGQISEDIVVSEPETKPKKKKTKHDLDSPGQAEEAKSDLLKKPVNDTANGLEIDDLTKKTKAKKKKGIVESDSGATEDQSEVTDKKMVESGKNHGQISEDIIVNEPETKRKKKKTKNDLDSSGQAEVAKSGVQKKPIDDTINGFKIDDSTKKTEGKKKKNIQQEISEPAITTENELVTEIAPKERKKKNKSSTDSAVEDDQVNPVRTDTKNETIQLDVSRKEKKISKKRKRSLSDENDHLSTEMTTIEESKRQKTEISKEEKSKKEGSDIIEINEENKQLDEQVNGKLEMNLGEKSGAQKSNKKEHNGTAEMGFLQPKTINAFQRVKIDQVEFAHEKLQDNSYWAKDGAEIGYGAKAQEVLGQVRGRDFRHEKTKKKRGSYRGGLIDLQSHSIKFNYSDEE